ncbi:MAG: hypothetical protein HKL82_08835 [Acidimicrobiaceae bacterium]|nr:hypothetical protein [Acidimicrobiaceae bacterium]
MTLGRSDSQLLGKVWDNEGMTMHDELADLLEDAANRVDVWTGLEQWTIEQGSAAATEVANTEIRKDGTAWGDRPVRTVYQYAQMAAKYTVEMARCIAPLVRAERPAPGIETLTRTSLEAASVVWWLLEENLTARQRVCRMQLLRRNNAIELAKSIAVVDADPSVAEQETVAGIEAICDALGLPSFSQGGSELDGEKMLRYKARVNKFTDDIGYRGAYNIYSGVAHAELVGLWRLFQQTASILADRSPVYEVRPNPEATFAGVDVRRRRRGSESDDGLHGESRDPLRLAS